MNKGKLVLSGIIMYLSNCFVWSTCHISLYEAVCSGDPITVEDTLLKGGLVDINTKDEEGMTPLLIAVNNDNVAVGEVLLNHGADINAKDSISQWSALHFAANNNNIEMAKMLLNYNADVEAKDAVGMSPFVLAAILGHREVADLLFLKLLSNRKLF